MAKLFDEQGNIVEALTPEETEAEIGRRTSEAVNKKVEEFIAENPDNADVIKLKQELDLKNSEIEKLKDKDLNFSNLRQQKEAAEKKLKETEDKISKEIGGIKELFFKEAYDGALETLAGEDEELKKKIEFNYKRLSDPSDTKEMVQKKLRDAYVMSTGTSVPDTMSGVISSAGAPIRINSNEAKTISKDVASVAAKLGLSEEDLKKHGIKIN